MALTREMKLKIPEDHQRIRPDLVSKIGHNWVKKVCFKCNKEHQHSVTYWSDGSKTEICSWCFKVMTFVTVDIHPESRRI